LLVHAHPDDESLTTGGTIAHYAALGAEVTLVTCTLGEEGEVIEPHLAAGLVSGKADQLGGYRLTELVFACASLGVRNLELLGGAGRWRDSGMAGTPSATHPRAFCGGSMQEQVTQLTAVLEKVRPQVVVTYDANGGYGHPDHIRAHEITMAATARTPFVSRVFHVVASASDTESGVATMRVLKESELGKSLPFRLPEPGELAVTPDSLITTYLGITDTVPRKLAAMRAHSSQITVDHEFAFALSNGVGQPVLDTECFVLARGDKAGADEDLFGGLTC
jgi:N-acetyl-1-D-myo-inositol-2-amino-2-deoxy-alpha-D-glucopyranoside deacetylase